MASREKYKASSPESRLRQDQGCVPRDVTPNKRMAVMVVGLLWWLLTLQATVVTATGRCGKSPIILHLNESANITSPNYPDHYGDYEKCKWQLFTPDGDQIVLHFDRLIVSPVDAVRLFTGRTDPDVDKGKKEFMRLQGYATPKEDILINAKYGWIIFQTFDTETNPGFRVVARPDINNCRPNPCLKGGVCINKPFDYACDCPKKFGGKNCEIGRCGLENITLLAGQTVVVKSPNYPDDYEENENCIWRINTPDGDSIFFKILDFDTENLYDVFTIGYGTTVTSVASVGYSYSGDEPTPNDSVLFDKEIWMQFESDSGNNFRGFKIQLTADVDNCAPEPCQNGATCSNEKFRYTCICPNGYEGPRCEIKSCGTEDIVVTEEKIINSPNYPGNYDNNMLCTWRFSAPSDKEMVVRFLEYDVADFSDVITIVEESESYELKKVEFSKHNRLPAEVLVQSPNMRVTFRTGPRGTGKGFRMKVMTDVDDCLSDPCRNGGECINGAFRYNCVCPIDYDGDNCEIDRCGTREIHLRLGQTATITSPNYPKNYLNDERCTWRVHALDESDEIVIRLVLFTTEMYNDNLKIGPGGDPKADGELFMSGNISRGSTEVIADVDAWLTFTSDDMTTYPGFEIQVTADINNCSSQPCQYSGVCINGIMDYRCQCLQQFSGVHCEIARCGPGKIPLLYGQRVNVTSPNYPDDYEKNEACQWRFEAVNGTEIVFEILEMETQALFDELSVGVGQVPGQNSFKRLSGGDKANGSIIVPDRFAWMTFESDLVIQKSGFLLQVAADIDDCWSNPCQNGGSCINAAFHYVCKCVGVYNGVNCEMDECGVSEFYVTANQTVNITSPNYPSNYPHDVFCNWTVHAADNATMGFAIDVVEVRTAQYADRVVVGSKAGRHRVFYGVYGSETFLMEVRHLWITFTTNGMSTSKGFALEIKADFNECISSPCQNGGTCMPGFFAYACECTQRFTGVNCQIDRCGDTYVSVNVGQYATITSPGYPDEYLNNERCLWSVYAENGTELHFWFLSFQTGTEDFVVINPPDHNTINFSDELPPDSKFHVRSNRVWILFTSNAKVTNTGFELKVTAEPALNSNFKRYSLYDEVSLPWDPAEHFCESAGGKLAKIHDKSIFDHVSKLIESEGIVDPRYWINAVKESEKSTWSTKDDESLAWFNLESDSQDWGTNRRCAKLRYKKSSELAWTDSRCSVEENFICEFDGLLNVAFLKPALYRTSERGEVIQADHIVDGSIDCTFSLPQEGVGRDETVTWEIDLKVYVQIIGVRLYLADKSNDDTATINVNGLEVRLGMDSILCASVNVEQSIPKIALKCDYLTFGRRVRISLPYERLFSVSLCEVQVFAMLDTQVTCADELNLSCPDTTMLDVMYINYGRTSSSICPGDSPELLHTNCYIKDPSLVDFVSTCESSSSCRWERSKSFLSNPQCARTSPYLETAYQCCARIGFVNSTSEQYTRLLWPTSSNGSYHLSFDVYLNGDVESLSLVLSDGNAEYEVTISASSPNIGLRKPGALVNPTVSDPFTISTGKTSLWIRRDGGLFSVSEADKKPFLTWVDKDAVNVKSLEFLQDGGTGYARQCPRDRFDFRCSANYCQNGGTCRITPGSMTCECRPGYYGETCQHVKRWRSDGRCGQQFPVVDGSPATCDPEGETPCCSAERFCGSGEEYCKCKSCIDYRPPVLCETPSTPSNGVITSAVPEEIVSGDVISYGCQRGFNLNGSSEITCIEGSWSDDVPDCVDLDECQTFTDNCSRAILNQRCINVFNGFKCVCAEGYINKTGRCEPAPLQQPQRCKDKSDETIPTCPLEYDKNGEQLWLETNYNCSTDWISCAAGQVGYMKRSCDISGKWLPPDTSHCISQKLLDIMNEVNIITKAQDATGVLSSIADIAASGAVTVSGDLSAAGEIIGKVIDKKPLKLKGAYEEKISVIDQVFETSSAFLDGEQTDMWQNIYDAKSSTGGADKYVQNLRKFATDIHGFMAANTTENIRIETKNIDFEITALDSKENTQYSFPTAKGAPANRVSRDTRVPGGSSGSDATSRLSLDIANSDRSHSYIDIPKIDPEISKTNVTITVATCRYRTLADILPATFVGRSKKSAASPAVSSVTKVNSDVFATTIIPSATDTIQLDTPLTLKFYHREPANNPVCGIIVYGHPDGLWSREGCWVQETNVEEGFTICKCDHLTEFGVVMEILPNEMITDEAKRPFVESARDMFVFIGLGLAVFFHALTLTMLVMYGLDNDHMFVLKNATLSLLIFVIMMFTAIMIDGKTRACRFLAAGTHAVLLTSGAWLFVEALHLLLRLKFFIFRSWRARVAYALVGWMMPVIYGILCTMVIHGNYRKTQGCWVVTGILSLTTIIPALLLFTGMVIILIHCYRILSKYKTLCDKELEFFKKAWMDIRGLAIIGTLFTLTWISAMWSSADDKTLTGYIFSFIISIEATTVFIVYCASNAEVIAAIRIQCCSGLKKKALAEERKRMETQKKDTLRYAQEELGKASKSTKNGLPRKVPNNAHSQHRANGSIPNSKNPRMQKNIPPRITRMDEEDEDIMESLV
ncbi:uncharacterized protein [Ptychodera flava]|uniref:uncharacterized protein n=1 Tax=Ptychodera flava TaxID=63121 RepID=UPI003969D3C4